MFVQGQDIHQDWLRATKTQETAKTTFASELAKPSEPSSSADSQRGAAHSISGVATTWLAADTASYAMQSAQSVDDGATGDALSTAMRNGLDDIANDPEYAAKRAKEMGTLINAVFFPASEFPKPGASEAEMKAFLKKSSARMKVLEQHQQDRSQYYEELVGQGLSGAETYAKLLEFNANLSGSIYEFSQHSSNQTWSEHHTAAHDYLLQAMQKASASEETA